MFNKNEIPVIPSKDVFVGNADAPVTLVEFGDYESEACVKAHVVVKEILELYKDKVKFNFRHFPLLKIHQRAHKAAEAAIGAAQDNKFWEMHEILLANRRNLGTISLKSYAKEAGVNNKNFLSDLINGTFGWYVQDDLKEGINLGVKDIPVFFVNGARVEGDVSVKNLSAQIEAALKKKKTKTAAK